MDEELKPCPCCGCDDLQSEDSYIMCNFCGLMIDRADAPGGDFINAWNQRAQLHSLQGAGEAVAWANWKVGTKFYIPFRNLEDAERSARQSEISATQQGPYEVVPLYTHPSDPGTVPVPRELLCDLCDLASDAAEQHRQAMGGYKTHRQSAIDKIIADARQLLADSAGMKSEH